MNSSDDQTKLSIEELMEIAKHPLKKDPTSNLTPIKRFIVSAGLEEGDDKVPAALIWEKYLSWTDLNNIKADSLPKFFKEFKNYFQNIRTKDGYRYILSQNGFDMDPAYLALLNSTHMAKKRTSSGKKKKNPRGKPKHKKTNGPGLPESGEESESET